MVDMKIDIVDNFLPSYHADTLVKTFNGTGRGDGLFPWLFINDLNEVGYLGNYYFTKDIVREWVVQDSYWMPLFSPLLEKLGCKKPCKLKVNLYPRTQRRVHHASHVDYESNSGLITCLYYVNTNNGVTKFDGTFNSVKSKKNRAIFFDGSNKHHSTTPTDNNYRCSINIEVRREET